MAHNHHNNQPNPDQRVFAMARVGNGNQYFLIGPDNYTETLNPPDSFRNLSHIIVLNCVDGYLCFYAYNFRTNNYVVVMWNPIYDTTLPEVPIIPNDEYTGAVVGCGVCPVNGLKIVRISVRDINAVIRTPWVNNIDVYMVSTGEWRNVVQDKPFMSCNMEHAKVCVNGRFVYMRTFSQLGDNKRHNFFISFDFVREEFGVVPLPERFSDKRESSKTRNIIIEPSKKRKITIESVKVNGSPGLLEYCGGYWQLWTTEGDADGRFSWLRGKGFKGTLAGVIAFRNNGEPVIVPKVKVGVSDVTLSAVRPLS